MLETILKMYVMAMATGVRSPLPHLFGPPGCGKSTVVEMAARFLGVNLHIINVSRLSPLEVEGVQMPHTPEEEEMQLKLLTATFWTQLKEGDILLLDEFLRAFPEVYNALLDILTARRVGPFVLPRVFIIAASNTTVSYDKALEDRLLHLPVPDPRHNKREKRHLAQIITNELGLLPAMTDSMEMQQLLDTEVLPMYEILDSLKSGASSSPVMLKGCSVRNLIGQAQLREVHSKAMAELLQANNNAAMRAAKTQYVFLASGSDAKAHPAYESKAYVLKDNDKLTELQAMNLNLNLQLIELQKVKEEKEGTDDDPVVNPDAEFF